MDDPPERPGPYYPGLDLSYDKEHRARFIESPVEGVEIVPMRVRGHNADDMPYDVRYEPYFDMVGLLPFVLQLKRKAPTFNHTAITALVDRWRPETHSFHLPCGEMTVTLQDFAMITALTINGEALTGRVDNIGWRQRVFGLTGRQPPAPPEGKKDNRTSSVLYTWLREFGACPADADEQVVQQYARAYMWYVLARVIFPDTSGDSASWMWLDPLRDWNVKYSWGSAGLAFLYRQLDLACRRRGPGASLGGAVWPITIWMWERIPVERPRKLPRSAWDYDLEGDEWQLPTIAYEWDRVEGYKDLSNGRYKSYTNELDTLTFVLVEWKPYRWERSFRLNTMCLRDQTLWHVRCPMICFYAVEWHLP
ncbi:unnamed protein product [Alopecurus aequalis]